MSLYTAEAMLLEGPTRLLPRLHIDWFVIGIWYLKTTNMNRNDNRTQEALPRLNRNPSEEASQIPTVPYTLCGLHRRKSANLPLAGCPMAVTPTSAVALRRHQAAADVGACLSLHHVLVSLHVICYRRICECSP
jgi:hypothetical protein